MKKLLVLVACLFSVSLLAQTTAKTTTDGKALLCKTVEATSAAGDTYTVTACKKTKANATNSCTNKNTNTSSAPESNIFTVLYDAIVAVWNAPACPSDYKGWGDVNNK